MDRHDVLEARARIAGWVRRTPLLAVDPGDVWLPSGGAFKVEMTQYTGTFKARGAFNRILTARERGDLDPGIGIVAASGGNAGLANAYAAARLGVPATVFVPANAPAAKVARLEAYGATVIGAGHEYADAYDAAMDHVGRSRAIFCHAYDQHEIVAGAGTLGLELLDQAERVEMRIDTVVVAVGGGGLMGGVLAAVAGHANVVAVEPVNAPTLHEALAHGGPVDVPVSGVAADSLGARRLGDIAWGVVEAVGVHSVLVDDQALVAARRDLWDRYRLVVEHGAAAALAAITSGAYRPADGERVAVVLCGANTDPSDLAPPHVTADA